MREAKEVLKYTAPLTLLYVESNEELRQRNKEIFVHYFQSITCASNAHEALDLYQDKKVKDGRYFDIVITDIEMPRISGVELCKQLLGLHIDQKIIALSAHNESNYLFELINLGISSFLLKPITVQALTESLYSTAKSLYDERLIQVKAQQVQTLNETLKIKIDQLNAAVEHSKQTTQQKDLFLANIAHEIRTPLGGILGFSDLLFQTTLNDLQKTYLEKINTSANLLSNVINDLLDFSKIEAGKMSFESINFDLNTVLNNVADAVSLKAESKNLDFSFDIDDSVHRHFIGDPLRLGQILTNLLSNSVKFTEKGSVQLLVTSQMHKSTEQILNFDIIDTGIGMGAEQTQNLFQPFSQTKESIAREYGGSGLGLSISKELAELMGGTINVKSAPHSGSTFTLNIPLLLASPQERRLYRLPHASMMGKKVLIIDPHTHFSNSLQRKFNYFHCDVKTAVSFDHADFLEAYDIVAFDKSFQEQFETTFISQFSNSKIVIMGVPTHKSAVYYDYSVLLKPCTQHNVFELLVKLYDGISSMPPQNHIYTKRSLLPLTGSKILLAEDNLINQQIVQELLNDTGIELLCVSNGLEVLKTLSQQSFDLVLMDIQMPIMGGYETIQSIRSQTRYNNVTIIPLTAYASPISEQKMKEFNISTYLQKPINADEFYALITETISSKNSLAIAQ